MVSQPLISDGSRYTVSDTDTGGMVLFHQNWQEQRGPSCTSSRPSANDCIAHGAQSKPDVGSSYAGCGQVALIPKMGQHARAALTSHDGRSAHRPRPLTTTYLQPDRDTCPTGSLAIPRASLRSLTTPVRYVTGWFPLYHCRLANDQASPLALAASPLALAPSPAPLDGCRQ